MAKKSKSAGVLPKRIAGVKVPKVLRKSSSNMLSMAQTPIIRDVIASSLVAAAAAIVGTDRARKTGKGKKARKKVADWAHQGTHEANQTAQAVGNAVTAATDRWLGGSLHWQSADEGGADENEADETGRKSTRNAARPGKKHKQATAH